MNKEALTPNSTTQFTGSLTITSVVVMLIGTALNRASDTDIWTALANNQMLNYLETIGGIKSLLITNISFWIVGVFLMGGSRKSFSRIMRCAKRHGENGISLL